MSAPKAKPASSLAQRLAFLKANFEKANRLGDHGVFDLMLQKGMYKEKSRRDAIFWISKALQRLREEKAAKAKSGI